MNRVYISGFSFDCALGEDAVNLQSAALDPALPDAIHFIADGEPVNAAYYRAFKSRLLSEAETFEIIERHILAAVEMAGWCENDISTLPIFFGSTSYLISQQEIELRQSEAQARSEVCHHQPFSLNLIADWLAKRFNNRHSMSFATSCTSSANALLYAKKMLDLNLSERAIVIGFESFNSVTVQGFHGLGLLAEHRCQPFSALGSGLVLGEGIACLALSKARSHDVRRELTLAGGATCGDTYNITATSPDGDQVAQVICAALSDAAIESNDIKAVKAHATGSSANDSAEQRGILQQFSPPPPIIALKPFIGHTLGACGVLEGALMCRWFLDGSLPALPYPVDRCAEPALNMLQNGASLEDGYYLFNYLGFGGNNTVLVMGVGV